MNSHIRLIQNLHDIWNTGDLSRVPAVYSEIFVAHWPRGWEFGDIYGHDGISDSISRSRLVFPDWNEQVLDMIVSEDKVVTRYLSSGTQMKEYGGFPASHKKISFEEISIYRIHNDLVAEQWCLADDLHCMNQIRNSG